jgi:hypothetical protein
MADLLLQAADRVGPFAAGSRSSDLVALVQQEDVGLSVVTAEEQRREPHRHRYDGLKAGAREFFFDYEGSTSLLFEKTGESEQIPDFIQLIYCYMVEDRLGGLILFGVSSEAGDHDHVDQQEAAFWEQAAEIAQALASKYAPSSQSVFNHFNFALYPGPPKIPGVEANGVFTSYPRLVTFDENHEKRARVETHYWGPTVLAASDQKVGLDVETAAAHTSMSVRRVFANDQWLVVVNHAVERYVRTIESLHVFTKLIYISRKVMDDLGRKLNSRRGAEVEAEARKAIAAWEKSLRDAEAAKQARISKLSQIL